MSFLEHKINMKKLSFIIILITVYLSALVIQTPAEFLNIFLDKYFDKKVMLTSSKGLLWNGNAHITLYDLQSNRSIDLGKISWNVETLQLFTGKLALNMRWNEGSPFWLTIDKSRLHIEHAAFNLPGQIAQFLVPAISAAELGGVISIRAENFSLTKTQVLGNFEVDWDRVTSPLSSVNPLGNYTAIFQGAGEQIKVNLKTRTEGPLILQGNGYGGLNQIFRFEGSANTLANQQTQLQQMLQLIGNETVARSGIYRIKI